MTDSIHRAVPFLDLKAQQARIAADLRPRLDRVLAHCQFILGPEVAELEATLAKFCGAKHCVGVSSGTDAIQIALMAEGIGRGDAVFLPAFTYTATAEVPLVLGATPVFVDVDPRTFQIDPGASRTPHRRRARRGEITPARADRRGPVRPAGGLAGAARNRRARGPVHAGRPRAELRRHAARPRAGCRGGRDRHQLLPVQAAGRLRRRRRVVHRERRTRRAVSQPAHPWRGHHALRGAAHRHERAARHDAGGSAAVEADGVPRRTGGARTHRPVCTIRAWATRW